MNRYATVFYTLAIGISVQTASIAAEQIVNADSSFATVSIANLGGMPAISIKTEKCTFTCRSMTFGTGPNKTEIMPIDGKIELRTGTFVIRVTELQLSTDPKNRTIDFLKMDMPKSVP